jgi:hypothetical protein
MVLCNYILYNKIITNEDLHYIVNRYILFGMNVKKFVGNLLKNSKEISS